MARRCRICAGTEGLSWLPSVLNFFVFDVSPRREVFRIPRRSQGNSRWFDTLPGRSWRIRCVSRQTVRANDALIRQTESAAARCPQRFYDDMQFFSRSRILPNVQYELSAHPVADCPALQSTDYISDRRWHQNRSSEMRGRKGTRGRQRRTPRSSILCEGISA